MLSQPATLGETMVLLADNLVADFDVVELLTLLADRCVSVLGVDAAGLMLAGPDGALRVIASSSEKMRLLELFELQTEQGPCLECFQTGRAVAHRDLTTATTRWPKFAPEAIANGFHSVHALPMRLRGETIGALNLFQSESALPDDGQLDTAQVFADIATIAILQYRSSLQAREVIDQLNIALNTRITIEQAKGIVAEHHQIDMDRAFVTLRNHARNKNLRLADVAEAVVGGTLEWSELAPAAARPAATEAHT